MRGIDEEVRKSPSVGGEEVSGTQHSNRILSSRSSSTRRRTPFPLLTIRRRRSSLQILAHERKGQFRDEDGLDEAGHAACDAGRGEEFVGRGEGTEVRGERVEDQPKPVKPSPHPLSSPPSPPTASETRSPAAPSSPASHAVDVSVPPSSAEDLPRLSGQGSRGLARFPALSVGGGTGRSVVAIGR
ncbi:hypothetical protein KC326_g75 [Hortaea werneckii]|nr:hypothetical protein KC326_g75 [Hortaea werneckii]